MNFRPEYPRPQFKREHWTTLNGVWEFEFDDACSGVKRGLHTGYKVLGGRINVPFSYQYQASGIGDADQHDAVWYRRKFTVESLEKRALLCFNAADYVTDVWVNGKHVITHKGGFTPFKTDITDCLFVGENAVVVRCLDPLGADFPRGKQSCTGKRHACYYIPNSGIWQSVWIEYFGDDCIDSYSLGADADSFTASGYIKTLRSRADELCVKISYKGEEAASGTFEVKNGYANYSLGLSEKRLWSCKEPNLYDVEFTLLKRGKVCDRAVTRFGVRKITVEGNKIYLNGEPLYQRLILDQGYWENGGLTPPSKESLKDDIVYSIKMGFNGARKHQKLEDPYYYYYAEELGFLVWCEMPSAYDFCEREQIAVMNEWAEIVAEAKNYTSVITYVPLNESWGVNGITGQKDRQDFARAMYYYTKSLDSTRLVSTNDGFDNIEESDILSIHDYDIKRAEEFPAKYKDGKYDGMNPQGFKLFCDGHKYKGQPVLFTEFGGLSFASESLDGNWGYDSVKDADDLVNRLSGLMEGLTGTEFCGYCYTQLTDVQQEVNGLLNAYRTPKAPLEKLEKVFNNK